MTKLRLGNSYKHSQLLIPSSEFEAYVKTIFSQSSIYLYLLYSIIFISDFNPFTR